MNAPLLLNDVIPAQYELLCAVLIGFAMGFVLERAGFGSCRKLVSQFYLFDMTVFKVMFTAIVTAMTGVYLLSGAGQLNLEQLFMAGTYLWPQIAGGLILGVGFVVGGYCPGTSAVAAASGKLDALANMGGILVGMFCYGTLYPLLASFVNSSALGKQTLYGYFGLPYGLVVVAVILMAAGGFWGATWVEKKFAHLKPEGNPAASQGS
jgi:uncharacterized membrane protein YedE/YeeE